MKSAKLYLMAAALIVICAVLVYGLYRDKREAHGIGITIGPQGVGLQKK